MTQKKNVIRKIVEIDEEKCNGCGQCIPNCHEGAMQIINGKARLVSDKLCDGLGACLGHCPQGAIRIIERKAEKFDEKTVVKEHLGCPSSRAMDLSERLKKNKSINKQHEVLQNVASQLGNWPIQLSLVPVNAPYLKGADILIAADCTAFSMPDFQQRFLKDNILIIACPKLDDAEFYVDKLSQIIMLNGIKSLTVAHMEVPCCFGLKVIVENAVKHSGKNIKIKEVIISLEGKIK